jgi:transposase-like protein
MPPEAEGAEPRAPSFDAETVQAILDSVEAGNSYTDAAAEAGIHRATFYRWVDKGNAQRTIDSTTGKPKRRGRRYRDFLDNLEQAEARGRARLVSIIANAVEDEPQLALQVLERKDPANWAPKVAVLVQDDREKVLNAIFKEFAEEPDLIERFLGAVAGVDVRPEVRRIQEGKVIEGLVVDRG